MSEVVQLDAARQLFAAKRTRLEDELEAQLKLLRFPTFEREYGYAKAVGRRHRADFAFVPERLIVQVEGGSWSGGRHTRGTGFERDCERDAIALTLGWRVLRVTGRQIRSGVAAQWIEQCLVG